MENIELNAEGNSGEQTNKAKEGEAKLFTQEEVNEIVKKRLERAKSKNGEVDPEKLAELETRENNLNALKKEIKEHETFLQCKSYLLDNNLPCVYLEALDTSDVDTFICNVNKLCKSTQPDTWPSAAAEAPINEAQGDLLTVGKRPPKKNWW